MAVTMARPYQRGRSPACDAFGERRHGSANNASTCSNDLREGHGRAEERPIILSWMGARFRDHWREIFPVSAAALFEEEVLIKAALNCNQELIVKLLGVIRASHAYTALGCSAACNNTLGPWFYFSNLGSDYFYYKSKQSCWVVGRGGRLFAGCSMGPRTSKSPLHVEFAQKSSKNTRRCCVDYTGKPGSLAFVRASMDVYYK